MKKNDSGFVCAHCGEQVPKLGVTSRNHCTRCLYSLHLDCEPGDRASDCGGLMKPVAVRESPKKGYVVTHKCLRCGAEKNNKAAPDDDFGEILNIAKNSF